jgi:hypothetical protein
VIAGELITRIQGLGYKLSLEGVNLRYRYAGVGDPPKEARGLLDELVRHKAEVLDLLRLFEPNQADLKEPFPMESERLGGERVFLCANETQAREIERTGRVAYLPSEVNALLVISTGMPKEVWKDSLSKIHEVKKMFRGSRIGR